MTVVSVHSRKKIFRILLAFLLPAVWFGYVSRLTTQNDRACGVIAKAKSESNLQRVLNEYSKERGGVGLEELHARATQ